MDGSEKKRLEPRILDGIEALMRSRAAGDPGLIFEVEFDVEYIADVLAHSPYVLAASKAGALRAIISQLPISVKRLSTQDYFKKEQLVLAEWKAGQDGQKADNTV